MQFASSQLFAAWFTLLATALLVLALPLAAARAPWRALLASPTRQHLLFGTALGLALLWSMSFQLAEGLSLHPLLIATATVVFGWELAILLGCLVQLGFALGEPGGLATYPANAVLTVLLPAALTAAVLCLLDGLRARNLFVFLFVGVFFSSMLGVAAMAAALWLVAAEPLRQQIPGPGIALLFIIMFPEAFMNGALVSCLAAFRPDLLRRFDEDRYLSD